MQSAEMEIKEHNHGNSFITAIHDPIIYTKGAIPSTIQGVQNNPYDFENNEQVK